MKLKIFLAALFCYLACGLSAKEQPKDQWPVKVGMAGYTFHKFKLDTTLYMMNQVNVGYLCVKDFHLPLNSTPEQMEAFRQKLAAKNIIPYAVGPIYMKSEAETDRAFAYAKQLGVDLIVGVPDVELLPYVEKKVKEYDIRLAIHLHGPDIKLYPNASDAWNHIKDLDARMGICLDVGHNLRTGEDPVKALEKYHSRVFDMHIKDITEPTKAGHAIQLGRGIIDFPALVDMIRKVKYNGVCSLEYERNMNNPMIEIAESIGYFRGVLSR